MPQYGSEQAHIYGYNKNGNEYTKNTINNYKQKTGMNIINGYIEIVKILDYI